MTHKKVLALAVLLAGCNIPHYSQGERVGVPYKFSRKGLFCKTWEGTMNLGGLRAQTDDKGNTSMVPNTWDFTVKDEDASRFNSTIQQAVENGSTLKVEYDQELMPVCNSEEGYFVTNVTVLNGGKR